MGYGEYVNRRKKFEAVMVIEGLLWIGTGEGEIMYEKMLESDAYYTDVVALID